MLVVVVVCFYYTFSTHTYDRARVPAGVFINLAYSVGTGLLGASMYRYINILYVIVL